MGELTRGIAILGSTGSIGTQTLDVVRAHPDRYKVVALAAGHDSPAFRSQVAEFGTGAVSGSGRILDTHGVMPPPYSPATSSVTSPAMSIEDLACHPDVDTVVVAIPGLRALSPVLAAIRAGKTVALASKEVLVVAGELVMAEAQRHGVVLLPVDSEHSAVWQCLVGEGTGHSGVARLLLTASGGPFLGRSPADLVTVTPEEALAHPTWRMGPKVTIDSATLMNKAFEVMEAHWLFGIDYQRISAIVHRQSIIHSLVEFVDGSIKAQLSMPDMRLPIQYALAYPDRIERPPDWRGLDLTTPLTFQELDESQFDCFRVALHAARLGDTYPAVVNAADEEAVALFLRGAVPFPAIASLIEATLEAHTPDTAPDLEELLLADGWARAHVRDHAAGGLA